MDNNAQLDPMQQVKEACNGAEFKNYITNHLDKRFEELKSKRAGIEDRWVDIIQAATTGKAPAPHKSALIKLYTDLGDMTYPSLVRKLHARETAWLDRDFFRWTPDGVESTETEGAYWLTDYQKDNLNNELSQFHSTLRAAIWQRELLNISAINYTWMVKPKVEFVYDMDDSQGLLQANGMTEKPVPYEFDLQGLKYEFISMFNLYPDIVQQTTYDNLKTLDLYSLKRLPLRDVETDALYSGKAPYVFESNVCFRSTEGLRALKDQNVSYSAAETRLNRQATSSGSNPGETMSKNLIEVRTAIIKSIKMPGMEQSCDANGRGFRVVYAKGSGECVPLFVEANPFPFEQKTIRICKRWLDPYNLYNDSETGLTFNQHSYVVNQKQMQAHAIARATMPNRLWSDSLIDAFKGSADELKQLWTTTGNNKFINLNKLAANSVGIDPTKPIEMGEPDEMMRNLQLIQQSIDTARNDIQQINQQVTQENGAGATAQYNKQMAQELDMLSKQSKSLICDDWLRPSLEYGRELAKFVFHDQKIQADIDSDEQKEFLAIAGEGVTWEDIQAYSRKNKMKLQKSFTLKTREIPETGEEIEDEQSVTYNPVTGKKETILNRTLFKNSKCALELEFEDNEYSKPAELAEKVQIYGQIMANIPDSPLKFFVAKLAIQQSLELTNDPSYAAIKEETDKLYEEMLNPPPPPVPAPEEIAKVESETQANKAKSIKDMASGKKMNAEADQKQLENDMADRINNLLPV